MAGAEAMGRSCASATSRITPSMAPTRGAGRLREDGDTASVDRETASGATGISFPSGALSAGLGSDMAGMGDAVIGTSRDEGGAIFSA